MVDHCFLFHESAITSLLRAKQYADIQPPQIKNLTPANNNKLAGFPESILKAEYANFTKGNNDPHNSITISAKKIALFFFILVIF